MKCAVYQTTSEARRATWVDDVDQQMSIEDIIAKVRQAVAMNGYEFVARVKVMSDKPSTPELNAARAELLYRMTQHNNSVNSGEGGNWCLGEKTVYCKNWRETRSTMGGDIFMIANEVYIVGRAYGFIKLGGQDLAEEIANACA